MAENQMWQWERDALNNLPMPADMSLHDQAAYTSMRNIYRCYKTGDMSKEQAAEEKRRVYEAYKQAKTSDTGSTPGGDFWRKLNHHDIAVTMATECARSEACKNPSLEALKRLLDIMDGLECPWISMGAQAFTEAFLSTCSKEELDG